MTNYDENPPYRFLEHTTDAEIEAYGSSLEEAFENAGRALEDTMIDIERISPTIESHIEVEGHDKQELLYEWLESLITKEDTEGLVFSKFQCKILEKDNGRVFLEAQVGGEHFDSKKHDQKTAIKAPTYYDMSIIENPGQVKLRFLIDL